MDLFLRTGANFEEKFPSEFKRPMRLVMNENIPLVTLSDGFYYLEALFTKDSINDFRKNFSHMKFSHLRDKIIYVKKWALHLRQRDSTKHFCTYNNLTVVLSIEQFKPIMHEQPSLRQVRHCKNIHHDVEEYKTLINSTRHAFISSLIETKYNSIAEIDDQLGLGTPTMPSMKELFKG